jgi:hypothetical protein
VGIIIHAIFHAAGFVVTASGVDTEQRGLAAVQELAERQRYRTMKAVQETGRLNFCAPATDGHSVPDAAP